MKKHPPLEVCGILCEDPSDPAAFDGFVVTCDLDRGHSGRHACVPIGQSWTDDYIGWGVLWNEESFSQETADDRFLRCDSTRGEESDCRCSLTDVDHTSMHVCRCGRKWHPRPYRGLIGRLKLVSLYCSA